MKNQQILDICKTILKSGKFNEESLRELTEYINKHPSKNSQWPQKILIEPLQLAWNDGIIDHDELKKLRKLVISITAGSINDDEIQSLTEPLLNDKDREEEIDNRIMRRWGENGRSLLYNRGLSQHDYNIFVQDCSDTPNPKKLWCVKCKRHPVKIKMEYREWQAETLEWDEFFICQTCNTGLVIPETMFPNSIDKLLKFTITMCIYLILSTFIIIPIALRKNNEIDNSQLLIGLLIGGLFIFIGKLILSRTKFLDINEFKSNWEYWAMKEKAKSNNL